VASSVFAFMALIVAGEGRPRIRFHGDANGLAGPEVGDVLLRQVEVDVDRVERLQRHDLGAGSQVLTEVDLTDADASGEGSADGFLGDHRALIVDVGDGLLVLRLGAVEVGLRIGVGGAQLPGALQRNLAEVGLGFESAELGFVGGNVQLHEQIALLHVLARFEVDFRHGAGEFVAHGDALGGGEVARGVQLALPGGLGGVDGGDGDRRRFGRGAGDGGLVDRVVFEGGEGADDDEHGGDHAEGAFGRCGHGEERLVAGRIMTTIGAGRNRCTALSRKHRNASAWRRTITRRFRFWDLGYGPGTEFLQKLAKSAKSFGSSQTLLPSFCLRAYQLGRFDELKTGKFGCAWSVSSFFCRAGPCVQAATPMTARRRAPALHSEAKPPARTRGPALHSEKSEGRGLTGAVTSRAEHSFRRQMPPGNSPTSGPNRGGFRIRSEYTSAGEDERDAQQMDRFHDFPDATGIK
jgi:hypothetical protein